MIALLAHGPAFSRADGASVPPLAFEGVDVAAPIDLVAFDPARAPVAPAHALRFVGAAVRVRLSGAIGVLRDGRSVEPTRGLVALRAGDAVRALPGARDSSGAHASVATLETIPSRGVAAARATFRIHRVRVQDAEGAEASARGVCVFAPRERPAPAGSAPDPSRIRLAITRIPGDDACSLELRVRDGEGVRSARVVACGPNPAEASVDLRVVASDASPGVATDRADGIVPVVARLGDRVEARLVGTNGPVAVHAVVGAETGPCAPRRVRLALHVVRADVDALSPAGPTRAAVRANTSAAIAHAHEAYAACGIELVDAAAVRADPETPIHDPPPPWVISVAEGDGLPARGGGAIRFRAAGREVGPVITRAGARPAETAESIAAALRRLGLDAAVVALPRIDRAADGAADVLVRDAHGAPVRLEALDDAPLSTDRRQRLAIGRVDFADGLDEFDLDRSRVGTLEERTLVYAYRDADPGTVDVFFVERFRGASRQGEAFVRRDEGPLAATVFVTRLGLAHDGATYTLAHELGHVLLDDPFHPAATDDAGSARVMGADSGRHDLRLVRQFTAEECDRMRFAGGALLAPLAP